MMKKKSKAMVSQEVFEQMKNNLEEEIHRVKSEAVAKVDSAQAQTIGPITETMVNAGMQVYDDTWQNKPIKVYRLPLYVRMEAIRFGYSGDGRKKKLPKEMHLRIPLIADFRVASDKLLIDVRLKTPEGKVFPSPHTYNDGRICYGNTGNVFTRQRIHTYDQLFVLKERLENLFSMMNPIQPATSLSTIRKKQPELGKVLDYALKHRNDMEDLEIWS